MKMKKKYGPERHNLPWILLTEVERSFIMQHYQTMQTPTIRGHLKLLGIASVDPLSQIICDLKKVKPLPRISLEQSYDLREILPLRLGT